MPASQRSSPMPQTSLPTAEAPSRNNAGDTYAVTLKCHDPNGEMFYVNYLPRPGHRLFIQDDAIRIRIEAWADGVPALA